MSTDAVDFRGAVGKHFNDEWAGATPIAWPGKDFTPPTDQSSWVRLTIMEGTTAQHEIGSPIPQFRETGIVSIQVFTKSNVGDGLALQLADQVATIFRRQKVAYTNGRAIFRAPSVRVIGPDIDGPWFQVNVSVPYIRDNI